MTHGGILFCHKGINWNNNSKGLVQLFFLPQTTHTVGCLAAYKRCSQLVIRVCEELSLSLCCSQITIQIIVSNAILGTLLMQYI